MLRTSIMQGSKGGFKIWALTVLSAGAMGFALFCLQAASGPDSDLTFVREVPSAISPARLNRSIEAVAHWPEWFHQLAEAKVLNADLKPLPSDQQVIAQGALVRLTLDPKKRRNRRFELLMRVTEW